ncbi:MAG: hypothetical protein QOK39_495, partial [Acidimicrobiaceae bacterium]|nr:hypothetical protein [Acidimicrobiaceae bacterium]
GRPTAPTEAHRSPPEPEPARLGPSRPTGRPDRQVSHRRPAEPHRSPPEPEPARLGPSRPPGGPRRQPRPTGPHRSQSRQARPVPANREARPPGRPPAPSRAPPVPTGARAARLGPSRPPGGQTARSATGAQPSPIPANREARPPGRPRTIAPPTSLSSAYHLSHHLSSYLYLLVVAARARHIGALASPYVQSPPTCRAPAVRPWSDCRATFHPRLTPGRRAILWSDPGWTARPVGALS